ncbi:N-6 DNA methylase [Bifidobacterium callitrichidarum]|uniref:Ribosomal RNA large subunit methyltransferase K/L-like methyltransferase domain-containing protein n=1 Tax=Bifidobacterium callitrichidarum TaxID=2052941 RepID=A0A2U2NCF5_9BIFI|nr:N-6 DNA methylase [Bifidobacterium callitrichidarum]PWG66714.1 hypothetical protein DF196_02085 [Bifidobacterium callitrichidarum]
MSEFLLSEADMLDNVGKLLEAARISANEEQLKINAEKILEELCTEHGIFWNSYTYEHSFDSGRRRIDAVHGSTVIEYEPPRSFRGMENAQLKHARQQAEEYVALLSEEEGRQIGRYSLIAWDGETITFGRPADDGFIWEPARPFDNLCLNRLLTLIADGGRPLVSPMLLKQFIGPDTEVGRRLLPVLFQAIRSAQAAESSTRTKLIYTEWTRLFGQVDGTETERLSRYLEDASRIHGIDYRTDPQAYVFALSTYIALVAKTCAVYSLASRSDEALNPSSDPRTFLRSIETGEYFRMFGIENMLGTDFFSWYLGDDVTESLDEPLGLLLERLRTIDFDVTQKSPESVRDLFKGLYMGFTPAPMRHALGEYYTPDWLASHVMDAAGWSPTQSLLDPTCGSGTFILEGLRRRLETDSGSSPARELLHGLYGFDLNPLAVLTARASIVVFLSGRFDASDPVLLPVFLADAINTADPVDGVFTHSILTEKGERSFSVPVCLAESADFFPVMDQLRICIDAGLDCPAIETSLKALSPVVRSFEASAAAVFERTIEDLVDLHRNHWNGIWCLILFDRIEAGCVKDIDLVAGNPPWVKWSNLPRPYAEFIKPICDRMDIFSEDVWVGGIQSDISTVVTYHALERFVRKSGSLAFLITGTVFKNESSQGFRRWKLSLEGTDELMTVETVEDYAALRPFEGVANWPTLLLIRRNGKATSYPVKYRRFTSSKRGASPNLDSYDDLQAMPVPGTDAGPWLVGTAEEMKIWPGLFNASRESVYRARKGVTTDVNGIFFVTVQQVPDEKMVRIANDPRNGRRRDVAATSAVVEKDDVFPLLRGRDVHRFVATPQAGQCVIVPQRGMFGDEDLPASRPRMFRFLSQFRTILEQRSSYRRFQQGKPFWSIWSTGEYTFSPYKVVWKEMSGGGFVAAYVDSSEFCGGTKMVIPDHKVYFVPVSSEDEAAYLTAFLNAGMVSDAINAYSSALSLGTSVTDYLNIPGFDGHNETMMLMASMAKRFKHGDTPTKEDETTLNSMVRKLIK